MFPAAGPETNRGESNVKTMTKTHPKNDDTEVRIVATEDGKSHILDEMVGINQHKQIARTECGKLLEDFEEYRPVVVSDVWDRMARMNNPDGDDLHIKVWQDGVDNKKIAFLTETTIRGRCYNCDGNFNFRKKYADHNGVDYMIPGADDE